MKKIDHTWILAAGLFGIALCGAVLGHALLPGSVALVATSYFIPVLGDLATAAVLFATWHYTAAHRSTLILVLTYGACGVLTLLQVCAFPLTADGTLIPAGVQSSEWLAVSWHLVSSIGAVAYFVLRGARFNAVITSPRFAWRSLAIALLVVAAAIAIAFVPGLPLPILTAGGSLEGLLTSGVGVFALLVSLAATIVALRRRDRNAIDTAVGLAQLALTLAIALSISNPLRFTGAWYAARLIVSAGAWFVYVAAVRRLVDALIRLGRTEARLSHVEGRTALYSDRILAVWRIASDNGQSDVDRFGAILDAATTALRPGRPMYGFLTCLNDGMIDVRAVSWSGASEAAAGFLSTIYPGASFPMETTTQGFIYAAGCTQAWDSLDSLGCENMVYRKLGWHSMIGAPLQIGRSTYFINFASSEDMRDDPFTDDDIAYVDVVASFFTSRFAQQQQFERIQFQMEHDALTGLPNRIQLRKTIRARIKENDPFTIAIVDLDGFRHINEAEGHLIADELLVEVAAGLRRVNEGNFVARLGADEFAVLVRCEQDDATVRHAIEEYAAIFRTPFNTGDRDGTRTLVAGASIGAACFPEHAADVDELLHRATVAMGVAKEYGGSTGVLFDRPLESRLERSRVRTVELAAAIDNDELALVYQPTFDLATHEIVGAEALVRWDHPERGRLLPVEFVPLAERVGLIGPLTRWVLRRLSRDLLTWQSMPERFRCYMNLAPQQLNDVTLIAEIEELLGAASPLNTHVGVEITETALMQNVERSTQTIDLLRTWGLRVAIDDFGTGYSSLSYLKRLPVDMIKIDRSFVSGLPEDEKDAALCEMLLRMSERFGLATLAEGIETEAQAAWLLEHGCVLGQGYLISKPIAFDQLRAFVTSGRPALARRAIPTLTGDCGAENFVPRSESFGKYR